MCLECILYSPLWTHWVPLSMFLFGVPCSFYDPHLKEIFIHKISVGWFTLFRNKVAKHIENKKNFLGLSVLACHIKLDIKCIEPSQSVFFKHTVTTSESSQPPAHVSVYSNRIFQILTQFIQMLITFVTIVSHSFTCAWCTLKVNIRRVTHRRKSDT